MIYSRSIFCVTLITGMVAFQSPVNAKMYRWVDDNGHIFYSDKVPPKESKLERNVLNKKGRIIGIVQAAKTKEQIALERRLKLLRKEQEKIISRQKSNDKVLLSTFRNMDDLRMTLNGKLLAVDAHKRVYERNLVNLNENLDNARTRAAKVERRGRKVPAAILDEIANIEDKISENNFNIKKTLEKRNSIQKKFDKDIERFYFLTKSTSMSAQKLSDVTAEIKAANTLGLFNCQGRETCHKAWEIAKQFVIQNSTTEINFNNDSIIMGSDPMIATDLSLSASKSRRNNEKVSIFLDIRCHNSTLGIEFCQSEQVKNIRYSFRSYIENTLKN